MKTILLSTLFSLFVCATHACSCFYISDYFCPNVQEQDYAVFKQGLAQCAGITPAEEPGLASLLLYPNPTSGELFLDGLNPAARLEYAIYSYSGQRLRSGLVEGGSSPSLSLSGLPSGLYLIRIQAGDGQVVLSRRILLERE